MILERHLDRDQCAALLIVMLSCSDWECYARHVYLSAYGTDALFIAMLSCSEWECYTRRLYLSAHGMEMILNTETMTTRLILTLAKICGAVLEVSLLTSCCSLP